MCDDEVASGPGMRGTEAKFMCVCVSFQTSTIVLVSSLAVMAPSELAGPKALKPRGRETDGTSGKAWINENRIPQMSRAALRFVCSTARPLSELVNFFQDAPPTPNCPLPGGGG